MARMAGCPRQSYSTAGDEDAPRPRGLRYSRGVLGRRQVGLSGAIALFALGGVLGVGCHRASGASRPGDAGALADAHDGAPAFTFDRKAFPRLLNPVGTETIEFYAGSGDGCRRTKTPHPEQVPDLTGAEVVPCPDALRDPAWNACPFGSMFMSGDQKKCSCVVGGGSPHATDVACPTPAK